MESGYKLKYFNVRGTAEPIRFILSYGRINFEDIRVEHSDWPNIKDSTPFGVLPVLEHNGKEIGESMAICRYIAKKVGLAGRDDWENLIIDEIVDNFKDIRQKYMVTYGMSEEERKKFNNEFFQDVLPFYLNRLDKIAQENNGFLALERLTWADLYFAAIIEGFETLSAGTVLLDYPTLDKLRKRVYKLPTIKKWMEERPKTDF